MYLTMASVFGNRWANEMVQRVKTLATKLDKQNSIPGAHLAEGVSQFPVKTRQSSCLHVCATPAHTHTKQINKCKTNQLISLSFLSAVLCEGLRNQE